MINLNCQATAFWSQSGVRKDKPQEHAEDHADRHRVTTPSTRSRKFTPRSKADKRGRRAACPRILPIVRGPTPREKPRARRQRERGARIGWRRRVASRLRR